VLSAVKIVLTSSRVVIAPAQSIQVITARRSVVAWKFRVLPGAITLPRESTPFGHLPASRVQFIAFQPQPFGAQMRETKTDDGANGFRNQAFPLAQTVGKITDLKNSLLAVNCVMLMNSLDKAREPLAFRSNRWQK
jgi:hypothetical protein